MSRLLGPTAARWIADVTPLGTVFVWTWTIVQWPLVFAIASTGIAIVYYFAPDAEQDWVWLTPGSIMATRLWHGHAPVARRVTGKQAMAAPQRRTA